MVDPELDEVWKHSVEKWMVRAVILHPDADDMFEQWLEEAGEGDEQYIRWAVACWNTIKDLPTFELEKRLAALRARE